MMLLQHGRFIIIIIIGKWIRRINAHSSEEMHCASCKGIVALVESMSRNAMVSSILNQ